MHYMLSGDSLTLDPSLCNGCGRCEEVCPHAVFIVANRKAAVAARGNCMQCGACRMNCPVGSIAVTTGVGCAAAIVGSLRKGKADSPSCDCG